MNEGGDAAALKCNTVRNGGVSMQRRCDVVIAGNDLSGRSSACTQQHHAGLFTGRSFFTST